MFIWQVIEAACEGDPLLFERVAATRAFDSEAMDDT